MTAASAPDVPAWLTECPQCGHSSFRRNKCKIECNVCNYPIITCADSRAAHDENIL